MRREDGAGYIGNMIWDFFNNIYAERYWIPLVVIMAIVVYIYMLKKGYYGEVVFAAITLVIPLTGGVMSMCRFIVGSYVIFIGIYDYLADKKDIALCNSACCHYGGCFLYGCGLRLVSTHLQLNVKPQVLIKMRIIYEE